MASIEEIRQIRLEKIDLLKEKGIDSYPAYSHRTHTIADVMGQFAILEAEKKEVTIAGRVMSFRSQGALIFLTFMMERVNSNPS